LDESIEKFLLTGKAERGTPAWELYTSRFFDDNEIGRAWMQHREFLLSKWKSEKHKGKPWAETHFKINGGQGK